MDLQAAIRDLRDGLMKMDFADREFRNSHLIRLNVLKDLKKNGHVTEDLRWLAAD